MPRYYWIGPESRVYHSRRDCPALTGPYRFWPVDSGKAPPPRRRPCKKCRP